MCCNTYNIQYTQGEKPSLVLKIKNTDGTEVALSTIYNNCNLQVRKKSGSTLILERASYAFAGGQITIVFPLISATPGRYQYDIDLTRTSDGGIETILRGQFVILPQITIPAP